MNGRIHFDSSGTPTRTIGLSGNATLGQNPVALKSATLTGMGNGATRLGIQVATSLHLSDALPSPDVTVGYAVNKSGDTVSATGPTSAGFEVKVAFPRGRSRHVGDHPSALRRQRQHRRRPVGHQVLRRPRQRRR